MVYWDFFSKVVLNINFARNGRKLRFCNTLNFFNLTNFWLVWTNWYELVKFFYDHQFLTLNTNFWLINLFYWKSHVKHIMSEIIKQIKLSELVIGHHSEILIFLNFETILHWKTWHMATYFGSYNWYTFFSFIIYQMEKYAHFRNVILGIIKAHYNIVKTSNVNCVNINAISMEPTHAWPVQRCHHRKFMILFITSSVSNSSSQSCMTENLKLPQT